jgi:hypothetical protein
MLLHLLPWKGKDCNSPMKSDEVDIGSLFDQQILCLDYKLETLCKQNYFKRPHELQQKPDDLKHKETLQKKAQMKRL